MEKEQLLGLLKRIKNLEDGALDEFLLIEDIGNLISRVSFNFSIRNKEIDPADFIAIAQTELWKIILEVEIDENKEVGQILSYLQRALSNHIIGFIKKEKDLKYSKESGFTLKGERTELFENTITTEDRDEIDDRLEDLIVNLNVPEKIKHLAIYHLIIGWNYEVISRVFDCSLSQARQMTLDALRIIYNLVGEEAIFGASRIRRAAKSSDGSRISTRASDTGLYSTNENS